MTHKPNVAHYSHLNPQPIQVINHYNLNFNLGSALKYLARAEHKGSELQDLIKARDFLIFEKEYRTYARPLDLRPFLLTEWEELKYIKLISKIIVTVIVDYDLKLDSIIADLDHSIGALND